MGRRRKQREMKGVVKGDSGKVYIKGGTTYTTGGAAIHRLGERLSSGCLSCAAGQASRDVQDGEREEERGERREREERRRADEEAKKTKKGEENKKTEPKK